MRGYWDIDRSTSHCVTFVEASEVDNELIEFVAAIRRRGFRIAYVDCSKFKDRPWEIGSELGYQLKTDHPPYHEAHELNVVRWLDDLIWLAHSTPGVVMVLDNAHLVFGEHRRHMTQLLEAFLVQVHHWLERKVPCHLCFQMSPHPLVKELFSGQDGA
ncbi:MAG TPA: hypothetical protein VFU71_14485 [Burkholderiaceae bacterium]|nr:hypothetical protein [Burkholderiaceae bacterium]